MKVLIGMVLAALCAAGLVIWFAKRASRRDTKLGELGEQAEKLAEGQRKAARARAAARRPRSGDPRVVADRLLGRRERRMLDVQAARGGDAAASDSAAGE